jgi:starch-binding outer membrane protein, SusD/RagB family
MKSITIILVLSIGLFISCKSDNKDSKSDTSKQLKKLTQLDALAAVSEIYDTYQNSEDYLIKGLFYPANFLSQDFELWGETGQDYKTFNLSPNNVTLNNFWTLSYEGILKANRALLLLDQLIKSNIVSPELGNRLKAECYFNRGLLYFYLAGNFGNVPLVFEENIPTKDKVSERRVFEQVANDFKKAIPFLPFSYDEKTDLGRATKGAALAYLGETFMWLKEYDKAIKQFELLKGHYKLMPKFLDIHAFKHQNNQESIFEIQFNGNDNLGWGRDNYSTFIQSFALPTEVGGAGLAFVNPVLSKSFLNSDSRKRASIIGPGQKHPDTSINISSYNNVQEKLNSINTLGAKSHPWTGDDNKRSGYYSVKLWRAPDPSATASPIFSKANVILLRYGQILLDLAECKFKTGDVKGAQTLINKVRKRAGLKSISSTSLMPVILNEYRHELAGEFSLWYVLRRTGKHLNYIKSRFNIDIPKGHDILPIPEEQLRLNKNLKQNSAY